MKIFFSCDVLLDKKSAQTTHVLELFKNFRKRADIFCFIPKSNVLKCDLNRIICVPTLIRKFPYLLIFYHFILAFYLIYYSINEKSDVIYTRQSAISFSPCIISKIFNIPLIVEVNGLLLDEIRTLNQPKLAKISTMLSEKLNYKQAKKIVAVTQGVKEGIRELYNIPDEKIVVIENGANTDLFRPMNPEETGNVLNLNGNYNYIGFSGSFVPWHGLENLVKSAPFVLKEVDNIKFILVGDGVMKEQIIQMVNDLNLADNFIFIDRVPYEEMPKYVNAFDVCVILKNKDIPGSPLKLWEYMACGKPVIATNTQDFRVLEKYNAGILVDPEKPDKVADAIITLLKNKELRDEMGKSGRKYVVENRSWEAVVGAVEKVMKWTIKAEAK